MPPNEKLYQQVLLASDHQSTTHGCNVLAQVAVKAALDNCEDWLHGFVAHLGRMRDICVEDLNKIQGVNCQSPQGCYLVFPDITQMGLDAEEIQKILLEKGKVAVVPGLGKWFGDRAAGHIRLSFATSEEILKEGLNRITKVLNER